MASQRALTIIFALFILVGGGLAAGFGLFGALTPPRDIETAEVFAPGDDSALSEADGVASVPAAGRVRIPGGPPDASVAALENALSAPERFSNAPEFDVVRIAPDGAAVLAGRAAPGAQVTVLVDGQRAATAEADQLGEFVATLPPLRDAAAAGAGRRIDLSARNPDGTVVASLAPVIVAAPAPAANRAPVSGAEPGPVEADPAQASERPPGPPPVVALRPGPDGGVEILQPAAPREGQQVTVDAVTYPERGGLSVSGRGAPGESVRVYINNRLEAETRVTAAGVWTVGITREVAPGRYILRVDQLAADGALSARAETPFERASPEDIRVADGAVVVQPGNNLWRIAAYLYGDGAQYTVIFGENRGQIRDPDLIYPGQILTLPEQDGVEG
ncbi:MAG: LysM peptidoglycan-binding domain-containing protein [Pseudomonadota bacterium]